MKFRQSIFWLLLGLAPLVRAETVHVSTDINGTVSTTTIETLNTFATPSASAISGKIFTGWRLSTDESLVSRDELGRSLEVVSATIYQDTTFIAEYLPSSQDSDGDGVADGYELYWYGDLDETAASDTDGDGYPLAAELSLGMNPLIVDEPTEGLAIITVTGELVQFNIEDTYTWTVRSEPEGTLFATYSSDIAHPGDVVTTSSYSPSSTTFAYWKVNGVPQRDSMGRALGSVSVCVTHTNLEIVAVCESDATTRQMRYWYAEDIAGDSDTDGDGYTFAAEMTLGMNPLVADEPTDGPEIITATGGFVQFNIEDTFSWTVRSEPEGSLFATYSSDIAHPGDVITTTAYSPSTSTFAYWTINGIPQRDGMGRALDSVRVCVTQTNLEIIAVCESDATVRQKLYWYMDGVAGDSDTDGDGYTFDAEMTLGMNPLVVDEPTAGAEIFTVTGPFQEANLQLYERCKKFLIDEKVIEFSAGTPIWPVVADMSGDGLWDLIVCSENATNVFVNVGTKGNPQFEERSGLIGSVSPWCDMNSTNKLAELTLDVAPTAALSATTNGATLLVSDEDGRIWYYTFQQAYSLQHKVWGGSYAGFASGLRLAAVDWEDDGDLDCLAGTADGKLMLLRDPKAGRPTNLKADAGVDSVKLSWDPNEQSRVRGYKVYRAVGESTDYGLRGTPALPTYRDTGLTTGDYGYKVSALSRFYTAGNSTPTETESVATEPVSATVGGVKFFWNDVNVKLGEQASVLFSIENACNFNVAGVTQTVAYATEYLQPVDVVPSGLAEDVVYDWSSADGVITVALESGTLAPGSGKFFTLVFDTLKAGTTTVGGATVTIAEVEAPFMLGDVDGDAKLTTADVRLMVKLCSVSGRKYNANQLKAGDFNGDGKLTMADYQLLRKYFKDKGLL